MDEQPPWAITLYVPDEQLPALNGQGLGLRAILEGAPELEFIVPRWWESSHTVRLSALKPANELLSPAPAYDEPDRPVFTLQRVSAPHMPNSNA